MHGASRPILDEVEEGPTTRVTFRLGDRLVVGESDTAAHADACSAAAAAPGRAPRARGPPAPPPHPPHTPPPPPRAYPNAPRQKGPPPLTSSPA
jgi:hypothetical protein